MSIQHVQIGGINLHPNISDSRIGDCEELINVKSENGNLRVDTDYEIISADIPYRDITIHTVGTHKMYIGKDSEGVVWFTPRSGEVRSRLYEKSHIDEIHIATTGNLLVISDTHDIITMVYAWKGESYEVLYNGEIHFDVKSSFLQNEVSIYLDKPIQSDNKSGVIQSIRGLINQYEANNKNAAEGGFLSAYTLTMYDNSEIGPFNMMYTPIEHDESIYDYDGFFAQMIVANIRTDKSYRNIQLEVHPLTDLNQYKNLIKSVNLYVSQPISSLNLTEEGTLVSWNDDGLAESNNLHVTIARRPVQQREIENQLLYLNKSWSLEDFTAATADKPIRYDVVFGGDTQTTSRTMPVTTANTSRAGKMLTYNSRIHYYDSVVSLNLGALPSFLSTIQGDDFTEENVVVYVYLKAEGKDIVKMYTDIKAIIKTRNVGWYEIYLPEYVMIPDSRAYKITIEYDYRFIDISLSPSPRYDYSYFYGAKYDGTTMVEGEFPEETDNIYREHDIINVSAQDNPIYFPVRNSYRCQGNIITIGYALEPISNVEIGRYPLYVFTDRGIFVLEQGTGDVLYGELNNINTDIVSASTQTRTGVAYIANGGVYVLNGRQSIKLSLPIEGRYDTRIRQAAAYSECCMTDKLYDVSNLLSFVRVDEYSDGATMIYSSAADELIISNHNYLYSYVFSFIYKQWRKIEGVYDVLNNNYICKTVLQSSSAAKAAVGKILVSNAVIVPEHNFGCRAHGQYTGEYESRENEKYALVISDVQVSVSVFGYPTSLAIIMSTLTKNIEYLDDYYNNGILNIYYGLEYEQGIVVKLLNLTTNSEVFNITLDELNQTVLIPLKGIGETITINGVSSRVITSDDSVLTIASIINKIVNDNTDTFLFHGNSTNNIIEVIANVPGISGNNLPLAVSHGNYISLHVNRFSGGKDLTMEPGDYVQIIDRSRPVDANKTIHIQTRPISFSDVYSTISRAVLYCRALLSQADNLSMYIFASNNLHDWCCVAAAQKSGISIDHIRTMRVAKSYKYYTIIIGGKVYSNTELGNIAIDLKHKYTNKLR